VASKRSIVAEDSGVLAMIKYICNFGDSVYAKDTICDFFFSLTSLER
jgi:hypothetical protein